MSSATPNLEAAHSRCANNRKELEASATCGCFYCTAIFEHGEVTEWIDWWFGTAERPERITSATALCPKCGIDSVIGSASGYPITQEFLSAMHHRWFS
jgi:hypothetical protein